MNVEAGSNDELIRVVLLEDHAILRQGVSEMLGRAGLSVVGEFADGAEFLRALPGLNSDVVVVDLALYSGASDETSAGLEVLRTLQRQRLPLRAIVLSANRQPEAVSAAYDAGASAYLYKLDATAEVLASVIRAVHRGERLAHPSMLEINWHAASERVLPNSPISDLSPRERQVLAWIGTGADNLKIAAHLGISERTVSAHVTAIYKKLGHENRTELALLARELNLRASA